MNGLNLYGIQLSDIQLFLNVAKYKNFTKAGDVMFMTQSGVSKRINQIEKELGLILFTRNKREVSLTPAGKILEEKLSHVMSEILDAITSAHIVQTGTTDVLRVAYLEWDNMSFINNIKGFIDENPQFDVNITGHQFRALHEALAQDDVDLIFTTSYDCRQFTRDEYNCFKVLNTSLVIYLSENNPFASKKSVTIEDLKDTPILMLHSDSPGGYADYVNKMFSRHNLKPTIGKYANTGYEHVGNLMMDNGVLFASNFFMNCDQREGIKKVPIEGENLSICAISKKNNKSLVLAEFLKYILSDESCGI